MTIRPTGYIVTKAVCVKGVYYCCCHPLKYAITLQAHKQQNCLLWTRFYAVAKKFLELGFSFMHNMWLCSCWSRKWLRTVVILLILFALFDVIALHSFNCYWFYFSKYFILTARYELQNEELGLRMIETFSMMNM